MTNLAHLTDERINIELAKCKLSPHYFIETYVKIFDSIAQDWIPFALWDFQKQAVSNLARYKQNIWLKPRQIGFTWVALAYALHQMLFEPIADVLIFSKREQESKYLLSKERLRGMLKRLPDWMKPESFTTDDKLHLGFSNGSNARAFPSNAGDSYTATMVIADEFDLLEHQDEFLRSVKPTIEAGGKLLLLSRSNKDKPMSAFKRIFRNAYYNPKESEYHAFFVSWNQHPLRTVEWYEARCNESIEATGGLDMVYEQYPENPEQALQQRVQNKRFVNAWVNQCFERGATRLRGDALKRYDKKLPPAINGLIIYETPKEGRKYVIGMDSAEGLKTSDDSALTVLDKVTGAEVAHLSGKLEPTEFAMHGAAIAKWYNYSGLMVERNNHGHVIIAYLRDNTGLEVMKGFDKRLGWASTGNSKGRGGLGKVTMYNAGADALRGLEVTIRTEKTYTQLVSIESETLRAPEGLADDCADSFVLAVCGIHYTFTLVSDVI